MTKKFNLVQFRIGGYSYAMPKDVAFKLLDALCGDDIYLIEERWEKSTTKHYASLLDYGSMPSVTSLNPAMFHAALLAHEEREAAKAKKEEE